MMQMRVYARDVACLCGKARMHRRIGDLGACISGKSGRREKQHSGAGNNKS
jgi:hypothetical protein